MSQTISFTTKELIGVRKALVYDKFQSPAKCSALEKINKAIRRDGGVK